MINSWYKSAKLKLSVQKTEGNILKIGIIDRAPIGRRGGTRPDRKRKTVRASKADSASRPPTIRIGEQTIKFKREGLDISVSFRVPNERELLKRHTALFNIQGSKDAKVGSVTK